MVACFLSSDDKMKLLPAQPHWFFILLAFGISVAVACKAHSSQLTLAEHGIVVAQAKKSPKNPEVGRKAAEKYFQDDEQKDTADIDYPADHFLAIHFGGYLDGDSYSWGASSKVEDSGGLTAGVTYRMGEWVRSMDLLFRVDFNSYDLPEGKPVKISILPIVQFPEASSRFPLYFGLGLGAGIYTKQVSDESDVSIDYQLLAGARYFNLFRTTGVFIETGIKNHFHVLSSGQFNGFFLAAGTVFTF
jgi:hypothetical protein